MAARSPKRLLLAVGATWLLGYAFPVLAAPKAVLWERWTAHDPTATVTIDHSAWSHLLSIYLSMGQDGVNRFAYGRVSLADKRSLGDYLKRLTAIPISTYNRNEQRAYWINLYNALTVKLILDYYPVSSITKISISPGLFSFGPWDKKLITVESEGLSLNDIEHRILRPIWQDPRLHYAVNCAAMGCPNLRAVAFTATNTDNLLDRGAREYINHPRGVKFIKGRLVVSSIYKWFKEDFGDSDSGVIGHLRQYATPETAKALQEKSRLQGHAYDWSLNDGSLPVPQNGRSHVGAPVTLKRPLLTTTASMQLSRGHD